jgi:hypothetical protein
MTNKRPSSRRLHGPEEDVAKRFPALAGRLNLVVPTVGVKCPAGHEMKLPAQYAVEGREFYCPHCRRSYRISSMAIEAARRKARVWPRARKPVPPVMDALYRKAPDGGEANYVPDRWRPAARRILRRSWRALRAVGRAMVDIAARAIALPGWTLGLPVRAARALARRRRARRKRAEPQAPPQTARADASQLAAYQELARAFPAIAERLRPVLLPEVELECPAGHRLSVLAELAAAGREVFCPHCHAAFSPGAGPAAKVAEPAAIKDTRTARRVPGRLGRFGRRVRRHLARMSGWMISCIIHAALLMIAMLLGIRVSANVGREKAVIIESSMDPPREYQLVEISKDRDIFKKLTAEDKGAESCEVDKPLVAPQLAARPAEEVTEDASLRPPKSTVSKIPADSLMMDPTMLMTRRGRIMYVKAPAGQGTTTPVPTGKYAPGVTAGLGPGIMAMRGDAEVRLRAAKRFGGGADTETAVELALKWLAARQLNDGSWGARFRRATASNAQYLSTSALATLAFLGAGYTAQHGKHKKNVSKALDWLIENQKPGGAWTLNASQQQMHAQGIAALALCEAYMMQRGAKGSDRLGAAAQKAVDFIVKSQCPYSAWGYNPYPGGGRQHHVENSVTIWNGMALKAAKTVGLRVDGKALAGMVKWLDDGQAAGGKYSYSGTYDGRGRTTGDGGQGSPCMVASSMMMRFWTGTRPGGRRTKESADLVLRGMRGCLNFAERAAGPRGPAVARERRSGVYFMHHGTIAMFQMGGKHWEAWNPLMKKLMLNGQHKDGHWSGFSNDYFCTALGALTLESYYRYSPLYHKSPEPAKAPAAESKEKPEPAPAPTWPSRRSGKPLELLEKDS